jgi:transcriptional regulator with XRE-family HTH domain
VEPLGPSVNRPLWSTPSSRGTIGLVPESKSTEERDNLGLGPRLAEALKRRSKSQGQLEKEAGLGDAYAGKLISGKRAPGADKVVDICRALNVSLVWLLTGVGAWEPFEGDPRRPIVIAHPTANQGPVVADLDANTPRTRAHLAAAVRGRSLADLVNLGFEPDRAAQKLGTLDVIARELSVVVDWLKTGKGAMVHDEGYIAPKSKPPTFAARLQLARTLRGWSKAKLSKKVHAAVETIDTLEGGGHVSNPMLPMLIASALKIDPEWLGVPENNARQSRASG